jgi:hypothetical protein
VTDIPWFVSFFSYVASGPPPRRLREIVALVRAGLVRFLGADVEVAVGPGGYTATSPTLPGQVTASALIEARVPRTELVGTDDDLLATLHARGEVIEQVLVDADGGLRVPTGRVLVTPDTSRLVEAGGRAHPARYAFGSGTSAATAGAFSRPNTNAAFFRQNDHAVRTVLRDLAARPLTTEISADPRDVALTRSPATSGRTS